ncbi:uncharacterized protein LOC120287129 [Eucalyptus grandis]|uniref:uncharacterized protein LOC120287129 n=1 Tax=Eucalyptus grandis TaxID=71139 RepID=UPI00192F05E2|nr:uncharacterized protein LOC120287129 [Eucalyptus grandis]
MADPVAIYTLGIITNNLRKVSSQGVDANTQLNAFWSPFLLLHLGGPDTITAYALEDNQLWLRQLFHLATQAGVTFYIFLMAGTSPNLSILTMVMILAGLIKYGERVYVLWTASSQPFRNSIPDPPPNYSKIMELQELTEAEGYTVIPLEVIEVYEVENSVDVPQGELLAAKRLINIFQRLFADLPLSKDDSRISQSVLENKNALSAFKIIEIELGFVYDLLYTKAMAIYTNWGFARHIVGLFLTCIVLVLFILIVDQQSSRADYCMSFILLAVAIFLEIYALTDLLFSDRTACWLIKKKNFAILDLINWLQPLTERRRWSDHMAQFSVLRFAFKEKHYPCHRLLKFLQIDEMVKKPLYIHHEKVTDDIKNFIVSCIREMQSQSTAPGSPVVCLSACVEHLQWTTEFEFDQIILIWHIATELFFGVEGKQEFPQQAEPGKYLSRYMLYILVMHPEMLPAGIGRIKFQETYIEALKFFDGEKREDSEERKLGITQAYEQLQGLVNTELNLMVPKREKSKYVLFHGCRLASQLRSEIPDGTLPKDVVSKMWVKILCVAAIKCKANYHAEQLRRGGELLTHVWFMMAHFGLTDHFQIPLAPAVAELIVR